MTFNTLASLLVCLASVIYGRRVQNSLELARSKRLPGQQQGMCFSFFRGVTLPDSNATYHQESSRRPPRRRTISNPLKALLFAVNPSSFASTRPANLARHSSRGFHVGQQSSRAAHALGNFPMPRNKRDHLRHGLAVMQKGAPLDVWPDATVDAENLDFSKLEDLSERVERLTSVERDYVMSFWSDEHKSFQIVPGDLQRPSLMSTCSALQLILNNKEHWKGLVSWEPSDTHRLSLQEIIQTIMEADWSGDAFQTPQLVTALARSHSIAKDDRKYVEAVKQVLEQRSRVSLHRQQKTSSYLRYQNVVALLAMLKNDMVPSQLTNDVMYALERAQMVAFDELTRQLAFYFSGDSSNFDVITLGFTLLAYYDSSQSLFLNSKGDASGIVTYTNLELVQRALGVIFAEQYPDGTFKQGEAIMASSDPRDSGNSYVFFFDLMQALLHMPVEMLTPYLPNLERCLHYAENNIVREIQGNGASIGGKRPHVQGWKSNHVQQGGAVCWATVSVCQYLDQFRSLLRTIITNNVLREFKGMTKEDVLIETRGRNSWSKLMDADLEIAGDGSTIKKELFNRVLLPQLQKEVSLKEDMLAPRAMAKQLESSDMQASLPAELYEAVEKSSSSTQNAPLYSVILFGPPGTAKTTLVQNMASTINWNFLTIDTADFMADGLGNIASRMTYIFDKLKNLEKTVILFDEIEEFCLDRENPSLAMESRLLTTAMLTQLNALRRKQSNIFVVATNRLRSFDSAVIRPGRFDMLLFVGTPNKEARKARLSDKLAGINASPEKIQEAIDTMSLIWDKNWDAMRFCTFAENESLMNEIVTMLQLGTFSEERVLKKIESIQHTATIRGAVKEDYIESEKLSRL